MANGIWISIILLAITVIGSIVRITMWMGNFKGSVERRFTEIHERKVALGDRITKTETDIRDLKHEIIDMFKEGLWRAKDRVKSHTPGFEAEGR